LPAARVPGILAGSLVGAALRGRLYADVRRVPVVRTRAACQLRHVAVDLEVARDRTWGRRRPRRSDEDDPECGGGRECRRYHPQAAFTAAAKTLKCAHFDVLLPSLMGRNTLLPQPG